MSESAPDIVDTIAIVDASDEQFDTATRLRKAIDLARQQDIGDNDQIRVPIGELDEVLLELEQWRVGAVTG